MLTLLLTFQLIITHQVERLLTLLDGVYKDYSEITDEDMQNRLCAFMYVGMLATHPLEDGNGQVASNLVSTILLEYGRKDYFINTQELGKIRAVSSLVIEPSNIKSRRATQIIKVPGRTEESIPEMQANKAMTLRRDATFEVLLWLFSDEAKSFRDKYVREGVVDFAEAPPKLADNLPAFCTAIVNYEGFLHDGTETDLVGDLSKTFADLSESHEKAMSSKAS